MELFIIPKYIRINTDFLKIKKNPYLNGKYNYGHIKCFNLKYNIN